MSLAVPTPLHRSFSVLIALAVALGALAPLVRPARVEAAPTELFFSEYVEGSSTNEALEIYNGTGAPVDLAAGGYSIQIFFSGAASAGRTINLSGSIADGDVLVVAHSNTPAIVGDLETADLLFNGDDAVVLRRGGAFIDVFGVVGPPDPGDFWGSGATSTQNRTLRRLPSVHAGDPIGSNAFDPAVEWAGFATDTFSGLGSHAISLPQTDPTAVGSADPSTVLVGATSALGVHVSPGANPTGTGITVTADLSAIGGAAAQSFSPTASPGHFAHIATVAVGTAAGTYALPVIVADAQGRTGSTTIALTVQRAPTQIADIQGVGHLSPMDGNDVFGVEGVVTAVRTGRSGGFWMTDPTPDADPHSSDGIFVLTGGTPADLAVGDLVLVDGTVDEFSPFFEDLTITEIVKPAWAKVTSGNLLPNPVVVGVDVFPPTTVIDDGTTGRAETGPYDPATHGIDFWETMEGTRVAVSNAVAVGPTNDFGELAVISRNQPGTGAFTPRGGLLVRDLSGTGNYQGGDFNPERLLLDDLLVDTPEVNVGDQFAADPVGVLDQSFGAVKLLVTDDPGRVDNGLQREAATPAGPHDLAVATFNVENLSARDCVDDPAKVAGLAGQIVDSLKSPDLIAVEEMQDNSGDEDDSPNGDDGVTAADESWECLIHAIAAAGGPMYDYRQIDPTDNADGGVPGGNIRVGFLFHSERGLEFVDRRGGDALTDTGVVRMRNGREPRLTVSPGRVLETPAGMETAFFETRKSLAGEFRFRGETIFVVANHFSSKGDDNPLFSTFQPPTRWTEFQSGGTEEDGWRHAQAQTVNNFVDEILAVDDDAHVIVLGDINDFDFSETVKVLTGAAIAVTGGPDADGSGPTVPGGAAVMHTLFDLLPADERYSYVFEGNSQVLDQILVSDSLLDRGVTYDVVRVNAEFFDQVSDHDPSVMTVAFQPRRGR